MLITSPDSLMVVGTSTIGASGMLTVEFPLYVVVPLSLEETFDSLKLVITLVRQKLIFIKGCADVS
jgi:hypothetical protein